MPKGSKAKYSPKQKRMARHIEDSQKKRGESSERAERIAWATVNKSYGKAGAKKMKTKAPMRKGGRKGGQHGHTTHA